MIGAPAAQTRRSKCSDTYKAKKGKKLPPWLLNGTGARKETRRKVKMMYGWDSTVRPLGYKDIVEQCNGLGENCPGPRKLKDIDHDGGG